MKKTVIFLLAVLLVMATALSLAACGEKGPTSVSQYKSEGEYMEIHNKLTWEGINSFPIKTSDMTIEEARQLCVDFYEFSKNFVWVAGGDLTYNVSPTLGRGTLQEGMAYAGFPYISLGSGNVYRLMDYMDEEKAVLDVANAGAVDTLFGNQCSISSYWGWARVVNSADYCYTKDAVVANGLLRVGPYTYDDTLPEFSVQYGTLAVLGENDVQTIYQSYAELKAGDGLVHNNQSGHIIMASEDAHVEKLENGEIDPENSYIIYTNQNPGLKTGTNEQGDTYQYTSGVDLKMSFSKMYKRYYVPFTFKELVGEDPIEETQVACSHTGDTITKEQLFGTKVTANYAISDIYAIITDAKGNEVYRHAMRATVPCVYELAFVEKVPEGEVNNVAVWGNLDELDTGKEYTVQIVAQLGTGERPTLWEGKLA